MPPIRPSVFRLLSRIRTPSSVASALAMTSNSLVCLTWPAITAWVTPASLNSLINVPSCPSEIQWKAAAGGRAAASASSGNVSSLSRDDGDVVAGAAGGVQHQERKAAVPGDQP